MNELITLFGYDFIQRAFISGIFIALICSILGLFLVLRNMSLIGHGLSHVSFGALAFGLMIGIYPFIIAIPIVVLGSFMMIYIAKKTHLLGDAAIGVVSSLGMALGIIFASISGGFTVDIYGYLFGNILSIQTTETLFSVFLSLAIIIIVSYFYNDLFSSTFDEEFARVTGVKTDLINTTLIFLTSFVVILSIKMVGALLVSALLVIPSVTALQLAKSFKSAIAISIVCSLMSVFGGIILSFSLNLPTGATIVLINIILFTIAYVAKKK